MTAHACPVHDPIRSSALSDFPGRDLAKSVHPIPDLPTPSRATSPLLRLAYPHPPSTKHPDFPALVTSCQPRTDLPRLPSTCQPCSNRLPAPLQHHFKPGPTDYPILPASRHPCPSPCDYPSHLATMLPLPTALPDLPRSHPTSTTHPVTSHVASFTYRLPLPTRDPPSPSSPRFPPIPTTRPAVPSVRSISTVHKGVRS